MVNILSCWDILIENEIYYFVHCFEISLWFLTQPHNDNSMDEIPEVVLDERKILRIAKKEIAYSVSIYVVNEKHFMNNYEL